MKQMILACALGAALSGCADVDVLRSPPPGFDTTGAAARQLAFYRGLDTRHATDDNPAATFESLAGQIGGSQAGAAGGSGAESPGSDMDPGDTDPPAPPGPPASDPAQENPDILPPGPDAETGKPEPGGSGPTPPETESDPAGDEPGKEKGKKDKKPNPSCEKSGGKSATC